ncbi:unnamed protein product [Spirodela intermedia]|uniref:Uncharacterized protein n=1 Tax=Spirodela intermedia TaxID=51605 RepID=A0A7I8J2X3_SPIIN|nr:unnamed protein product [Spirodela intermedia]CAA6664587.1 unnamed protein product [Spirodela intermedia]
MKANYGAPLVFHSLVLLFLCCGADQASSAGRRTYIVRVDGRAKPAAFPTHRHWYDASLSAAAASAADDLDPHPAAVIHTYASVLHGFSARLSPLAVDALRSRAGIVAVYPEQVRQVETTRSPQFLGLKSADGAGLLLAESDFGSDLVVGVIDTGIWPERRSFSDRASAGPSQVEGRLIGARYFSGGYEATSGRMNESAEERSPRDTDGHGTHTASIAAGRYVYPASTLGYARGVASGMAPKARFAAYKVCWAAGCFDSDILAAFDSAVADGVDVISLSVGGVVVPYYLDAIAVGAFSAMEAGIFVSADFPADVKLGNGVVVPGVSVYGGPGLSPRKLYPLIYAGSEGGDGYSASLCLEGSLNPAAVRGKIVVCDRGINSRAAKGEVVKKAGGVAMILANGVFDGEGLVADCHVLPATAVGAAGGDVIRRYIADSPPPKRAPTATIVFRGTRLGVRPAPVVASFSARGPNPQSPEILKPDVVAPGLNILAAWPDGVGPAGISADGRRTEFNILSGTASQGGAPGWSPAAIKSALMTTAYTKDNRGQTMLDESTGNASTVMDLGAGHVDPQKAMDPGLVYDSAAGDYVAFLCNLNYTQENIRAITRRSADCGGARRAGHAGNLNYPSISVVFVQGGRARMSTHIIRTVTNVGDGRSAYEATVKAPRGSTITVEPARLVFRRTGQKLSFLVRVEEDTEAEWQSPGSSTTKSGTLTWSDGRHTVTSPIVVTVQAPLP